MWPDNPIVFPIPLTPAPILSFDEAEDDQTLGTIHDRQSPEDGIALPSSETILGKSAHPRRNLASDTPCRRANVRTRRSQHGVVLTQSPARAGHASRMHQIFENAGRGYTTSADAGGVLYPQLANISRKASPFKPRCTQRAPPEIGSDLSGLRSGSLCRSTGSSLIDSRIDPPLGHHLVVSECTSGSWSDDSGYINAGTCRKTGIAVSPSQSIENWLLNVNEAVNLVDTAENEQSTCIRQIKTAKSKVSPKVRNCVAVDKVASSSSFAAPSYSWTEPTASRLVANSTEDPFISDDLVRVKPTSWALKKSCNHIRIPPAPARLKEYVPDSCERLNFNKAISGATSKSESKAVNMVTPCPTPTQVKQNHTSRGSSAHSCTEDDGGAELSPLSPNVCIERGPSRYYTSPKSPSIDRAPESSDGRRLFVPRSTRLKENIGSSPLGRVDDKGPRASHTPLSLRSRWSQTNTTISYK
ncbi:hypothetical protein J1614_007366 [Plenodomus biglobosus]|nr:hypothetical protein J1614_007366 [Plenodomus biglobosus]